MIGTPASAISRDQLAYAHKAFLDMHAGNQSFFVKRPEIVGILKNLAEVAKAATRDMAAAGVGNHDSHPAHDAELFWWFMGSAPQALRCRLLLRRGAATRGVVWAARR